MPNQADADRLQDILDEADFLAAALEGYNLAAFQADKVRQRAVLHSLQTIGQAGGD
jgi:uncharacterized protein with HEPN domain